MALSAFAGSFTKNTGTGNQSVTGVGFLPKAIIFWTAYATAASTPTDHVRYSVGFTAGATESFSAGFSSQNGVTTSNTSTRGAAKALTVVQYGESLLSECGLVSFDADGFTVDWTTNGGGAQIIHFLALGGTDITGQKVTTFTSPTSTGFMSVTGIGFQPKLLVFLRPSPTSVLAIPGSAAGAQFMLGAAADGQFALSTRSPDATATTLYSPRRVIKTDRCIFSLTDAGATADEASLVSMDSDGFTLNYTAANVADTVGVLALGGVFSAAVGPATSNPNAGVPFSPSALMLASTHGDTTPAVENRVLLGATTGTTAARNQVAEGRDISVSDGSNTDAFVASSTTACLMQLGTGPNSILIERALSSFDAGGYTLTGGNFSGRTDGYLALASQPAGASSGIDSGEEG